MSTSTSRLSHADLTSPADMRADCEATSRRLEGVARAATAPPPSLRYDDFPREVAKPSIEVSEAAARIAAALHLHLD